MRGHAASRQNPHGQPGLGLLDDLLEGFEGSRLSKIRSRATARLSTG